MRHLGTLAASILTAATLYLLCTAPAPIGVATRGVLVFASLLLMAASAILFAEMRRHR